MKKILLIITLGVFTAFSFSACSGDKNGKDESTTQTQANVTAESNTNATMDNSASENKATANVGANVYYVKSATPDTANRIIDFTWEEDGKEMSFKEYTKGKSVFVNFWGTWCGPCRQEIPDLIAISNELDPEGFVMIGVALERDMAAAMQNVTAFAKSQGIPYKLFVDKDSKLISSYVAHFGDLQGVPTSFLFNKNWELKDVIVGARSKDEFMTSIQKIL